MNEVMLVVRLSDSLHVTYMEGSGRIRKRFSQEKSFERRTFPTGSTTAEKPRRIWVASRAQLGHVNDSIIQGVSGICGTYLRTPWP
jgi:hypothetical protein